MEVEVSPASPCQTSHAEDDDNVDDESDEFSAFFDPWSSEDLKEMKEIEECVELGLRLGLSPKINDSGIGSSQSREWPTSSNSPLARFA